ncbi:MAG: TIGR03751 family conjugal transfer lipoprotein [Dehalococcoidia bacterium]
MHNDLTQTLRPAMLLLLAVMLAACSTAGKDIFPKDLPTMEQIYHGHYQAMGMGDPGDAGLRDIRERAGGLSAPVGYTGNAEYARDAYTELAARFPRLPNPDILMYVDPHLTASGEPVPGYTTSFPLYESVEYALPGEAPPAGGYYPPLDTERFVPASRAPVRRPETIPPRGTEHPVAAAEGGR